MIAPPRVSPAFTVTGLFDPSVLRWLGSAWAFRQKANATADSGEGYLPLSALVKLGYWAMKGGGS
jgi:hypothetical protein